MPFVLRSPPSVSLPSLVSISASQKLDFHISIIDYIVKVFLTYLR
jgi:hypothetical protein